MADALLVATDLSIRSDRVILRSVAENLLGNPPCDIAVVKAW